jgi:glucan phosphorylase
VQELLLGIGGWRLLHTLGLRPEVCHLNEGHAAFAVLERTRTLMTDSGLPFDAAMAITRAGNVFTTHTPVPAGFDRFSPELIKRYLGSTSWASILKRCWRWGGQTRRMPGSLSIRRISPSAAAER